MLFGMKRISPDSSGSKRTQSKFLIYSLHPEVVNSFNSFLEIIVAVLGFCFLG